MKTTRRSVLILLFCLLVTLPAVPRTPNQKFLVFVGTYTDKTDSKGIYAYEFDAATGKLAPKGLAAETSNPSWLVIHPNGKWAYAANESGKQSAISAYSIDAKSARLTLLNQIPALGEDPCHLSFDKTGKYLFAANYTSGNVAVFPILPDGKLGEHTAAIQDAGALGPNKERQEGPHAHWVGFPPNSNWLHVADLGLDRILSYPFNPSTGQFPRLPLDVLYARPFNSSDSLRVSPGDGPRHVAFSADGNFMYALGEIQSTVSVFSDQKDGILPIQGISTLPPDYKGRKEAAEIAIHPSGKWLFASNRGHDSMAVFVIDPAKGILTLSAIVPTGGKEPRHFAIDPTGKFLLAENQNSNSIVVFRIDPATGDLSQVSTTEGVPSPVCLVFYPAR